MTSPALPSQGSFSSHSNQNINAVNRILLNEGNITFLPYNDKSCRIQEPAIIGNYTSEVIEDRLFKYTFVFTDEVLANPIDCQ